MTDRTHPDSGRATGQAHIIRYALELGLLWVDGDGRDKVREALDALDTLEAQLEAIGAGGVSGPLMGQPQAMPDLSQLTERGAKAWAGVDAQGLREGADMHKERAGRFTKKPVTIDAWLIDFGNKPLPDWVNEAFRTEAIDWCPAGEGLYINTLEGYMLGANGSWLIKGVQGELYACKPDIFAATYECASLSANAGGPTQGAFQRALSIRTAQGWTLRGDKVPVLYTDEINGEQVCRDDVWLCTTAAFAAPPTAQAEGLTWTVFNSGAQVAEVESLAEAMEYLTPARLARQWCAVCVVDQSNIPPTSAEGVEHG